ncbi:hypothetical protein BDN72DRAFT_866308 [Pluteus cervinus]|uniref:Uncharacterized protein n=1 Tax=Pluteus cervinus TaxID=181527 RepID=A0ACD2ZZC8_9AGAR|nr:hypothetical protein BDN72DRAFT_866308 [Pluteus cervinus]
MAKPGLPTTNMDPTSPIMATSGAFKPSNHNSFDSPAVASLADAVKGGLMAIEVLLAVRGPMVHSLNEEPLLLKKTQRFFESSRIPSPHPTYATMPAQPSASVVLSPFPNSRLTQPPSSSGAGHQHCHICQEVIAFPNLFCEAIGLPPIPANTAMTHHHQGSTATSGGPSEPLDPFVKIDPETHNIISTAGGDDVKVVVRSPGPQPPITVNETATI